MLLNCGALSFPLPRVIKENAIFGFEVMGSDSMAISVSGTTDFKSLTGRMTERSKLFLTKSADFKNNPFSYFSIF